MITREQAKVYYDKYAKMVAKRNFTPNGLLNHLRRACQDWQIEPYLFSQGICYISNEEVQITFFFKSGRCYVDRCLQIWDEECESWIDERL